jgi:hypothetical protein
MFKTLFNGSGKKLIGSNVRVVSILRRTPSTPLSAATGENWMQPLLLMIFWMRLDHESVYKKTSNFSVLIIKLLSQ